jgi:PadR family transcriptional regulator, regulatory protein AphA
MRLSTTSYAILGLLDLRPWTAYELTKHMRRNLHYFFPRAESGIYGEFKKLTTAGLATAEASSHGNRTRTTYTITDKGREALHEWLATPTERAFAMDSEGMLRVLYAGAGTIDDLRRTAGEFETEATEMLRMAQDVTGAFLAGTDVAQRDAHLRVILIDFTRLYVTAVLEWSHRTQELLATWDDLDPEGKEALTRERFQQWAQQIDALLDD